MPPLLKDAQGVIIVVVIVFGQHCILVEVFFEKLHKELIGQAASHNNNRSARVVESSSKRSFERFHMRFTFVVTVTNDDALGHGVEDLHGIALQILGGGVHVFHGQGGAARDGPLDEGDGVALAIEEKLRS
eukprot:TRINITY_DN32680_c0_g1_i1.p1 TRINITY_DN32680_c0_g1~~TRINITY_DN32680_c0_g1_i1.p1  ORF type:complete len:131 (-),score=17.02 TRINITY_DN32680_c0_g1_i1:108-500(-)